MKNYKKLIAGSLLTAVIMASPMVSFADNDKGKSERNEKKEEKNNRFSWFGSNWFNGKNAKNINTVPVISGLTVTSNKSNKATIKWNTDLRSNSMIWLSTTSPVDTSIVPKMKRNDRVIKHKFEINKLQANTKYYVVVGSSSFGGTVKSNEMSFTTGTITSNVSTPVITSVTGPATLQVGENGNFVLKANDPQGKSLTYGVNWGDGNSSSQVLFNQSVELGHIYNQKGIYVAKFTVTNSDGKKATYPMQIKVIPASIVDTTAPIVSAFVLPETATTLTVNITTFTATDVVGVTGYKLTETSTAPLAGDTGWTATKPTTYTFASAGSKTLYAWAKDGSGNVSGSLNDSVVITLSDTTAPVISSIMTNVSGTNVTISWTTNELSTSNILYSTGTPVDTNSVSTPKVTDSALATNHSLSIPGLTSNTLYHFVLKSVDASNNASLSSEATFSTN